MLRKDDVDGTAKFDDAVFGDHKDRSGLLIADIKGNARFESGDCYRNNIIGRPFTNRHEASLFQIESPFSDSVFVVLALPDLNV